VKTHTYVQSVNAITVYVNLTCGLKKLNEVDKLFR